MIHLKVMNTNYESNNKLNFGIIPHDCGFRRDIILESDLTLREIKGGRAVCQICFEILL